jgi:hypothetical protein
MFAVLYFNLEFQCDHTASREWSLLVVPSGYTPNYNLDDTIIGFIIDDKIAYYMVANIAQGLELNVQVIAGG